ncbi:CobW/HypB/UreG, nucleotide-binding domain-containing protein [Haematococcus lacustris]
MAAVAPHLSGAAPPHLSPAAPHRDMETAADLKAAGCSAFAAGDTGAALRCFTAAIQLLRPRELQPPAALTGELAGKGEISSCQPAAKAEWAPHSSLSRGGPTEQRSGARQGVGDQECAELHEWCAAQGGDAELYSNRAAVHGHQGSWVQSRVDAQRAITHPATPAHTPPGATFYHLLTPTSTRPVWKPADSPPARPAQPGITRLTLRNRGSEGQAMMGQAAYAAPHPPRSFRLTTHLYGIGVQGPGWAGSRATTPSRHCSKDCTPCGLPPPQALQPLSQPQPQPPTPSSLAAAQPDGPVPITVLSGFLGAGKSSLLLHLLDQLGQGQGPQGQGQALQQGLTGLRVGVIVNDLAVLNIDGQLVKDVLLGQGRHQGQALKAELQGQQQQQQQGGTSGPGAEPIVELSNGCICCSLKGELLQAVAQLLSSCPDINYLVVEGTGVGQPLPVAAALLSCSRQGRSLADYVRIDTMVTVVDASRFMHLMATSSLPPRAPPLPPPPTAPPAAVARDPPTPTTLAAITSEEREEVGCAGEQEEELRPLAELLVDQVEFADVVLLNKIDLAGRDGGQMPGGSGVVPVVEAVEAAVRGLNPRAHVLRTVHGRCDPGNVMLTGRFDPETSQATAGWQQELLEQDPAHRPATQQHQHRTETEVYDLHSLVFEARRPFHPARLAAWLGPYLTNCLANFHAMQSGCGQGQGQGHAGGPHEDGLLVNQHPGCTKWPLQPPVLPQQQQQQQEEEVEERIPSVAAGTLPSGVTLLRSKGFFWLASHPQIAWTWSTAGPAAASFTPCGEWLAPKLPRHCWPAQGHPAWPEWDRCWGDRGQRLVLIGQGMAPGSRTAQQLRQSLEACLLTGAESRAQADELYVGEIQTADAEMGNADDVDDEAVSAEDAELNSRRELASTREEQAAGRESASQASKERGERGKTPACIALDNPWQVLALAHA